MQLAKCYEWVNLKKLLLLGSMRVDSTNQKFEFVYYSCKTDLIFILCLVNGIKWKG